MREKGIEPCFCSHLSFYNKFYSAIEITGSKFKVNPRHNAITKYGQNVHRALHFVISSG